MSNPHRKAFRAPQTINSEVVLPLFVKYLRDSEIKFSRNRDMQNGLTFHNDCFGCPYANSLTKMANGWIHFEARTQKKEAIGIAEYYLALKLYDTGRDMLLKSRSNVLPCRCLYRHTSCRPNSNRSLANVVMPMLGCRDAEVDSLSSTGFKKLLKSPTANKVGVVSHFARCFKTSTGLKASGSGISQGLLFL